MSTAPTPITTTTLNDKIEQAAAEAGQIASIFSPAVGAAIESGVAVEPLIYGLISMFVGLFKHHTTGTVSTPAVAQAVAAAVPPRVS